MEARKEVRFRSDVTVELVKHAASDADVLWAARVSTKGEQSLAEIEADPERSKGLINFLMRDRHGTPFEHSPAPRDGQHGISGEGSRTGFSPCPCL